MKHNCWTNEELDWLKDNYINAPLMQACLVLPQHTYFSIKAKASQLRLIKHPPRAPIPPLILTDLEKGYLAGIIDGEGCITLSSPRIRKYNDRRRKYYGWVPPYCFIQIANTDLALLNRCQQICQGFGNIRLRKNWRADWKPCFTYEISNPGEVRAVLKAMYPFLLVKAPQAKLVLLYIEKFIMQGRLSWSIDKKLCHDDKVNGIISQIRHLNKRGNEEAKHGIRL